MKNICNIKVMDTSYNILQIEVRTNDKQNNKILRIRMIKSV